MKPILLILALALVAPMAASSQTGGAALITPPPSESDQAGKNEVSGTVTEFIPGQIITVKTKLPNPMSFAISKSVRCVNSAGKTIKLEKIQPGASVLISYIGNEDTRTATRIVVGKR